jgi:uncharacterized membrane protein
MTIRRQLALSLTIIATVATILRFGISGRSGLWADELFSLAIATGHSLEQPAAEANPALGDFAQADGALPAEKFRRYLRHESPPANPARVVRAVHLSDTSPPLYYLLLYCWMLVGGSSDLALRAFSVLCALGCFPLLAAIAYRVGGKEAVISASVLFALSPLAVLYSTEGRMYSLVWLCALGTLWLSLLLYESGGRWWLYALWILAAAAGLLTHYFFLFPWLAISVFLIFFPGNFSRQRLLLCGFCTALVVLPWYWLLPDSLGRWRVTNGWLNVAPAGFHRLNALFAQSTQFFSSSGLGQGNIAQWSAITALVLFALLFTAAIWNAGWKLFAGSRLIIWLWFIVASLSPTLVDLVQHTYTAAVPRYGLAALPAACLLAAMTFQYFSRPVQFAMIFLVALSWAPPLLTLSRQQSRNWEPFRQVARETSSRADAGDVVLVHSIPSGVLGIARYCSGACPIGAWVGQLGTRRVPESLTTLAGGANRIFFVKIHNVGESAPEEEWLRTHATILRDKRFQQAEVVDFQRRDAEKF